MTRAGWSPWIERCDGLIGEGVAAGPVLPLMTTRGWADAIVRVWLFPTW